MPDLEGRIQLLVETADRISELFQSLNRDRHFNRIHDFSWQQSSVSLNMLWKHNADFVDIYVDIPAELRNKEHPCLKAFELTDNLKFKCLLLIDEQWYAIEEDEKDKALAKNSHQWLVYWAHISGTAPQPMPKAFKYNEQCIESYLEKNENQYTHSSVEILSVNEQSCTLPLNNVIVVHTNNDQHITDDVTHFIQKNTMQLMIA